MNPGGREQVFQDELKAKAGTVASEVPVEKIEEQYRQLFNKIAKLKKETSSSDNGIQYKAYIELDKEEPILKALSERLKDIREKTEEIHTANAPIIEDYEQMSSALDTEEKDLKNAILQQLEKGHWASTVTSWAADSQETKDILRRNALLNEATAIYDQLIGKKEKLNKSALNVSDLSGASGGLSQAKAIVINFNSGSSVQKNEVKDGSGIQANADRAVEILIRTLNNISFSQSGTM
jgi:uncharacterized protein YoxC